MKRFLKRLCIFPLVVVLNLVENIHWTILGDTIPWGKWAQDVGEWVKK